MAKQIIMLSLSGGNGASDQQVSAAFWFPIPAGQQIPNPSAVSQYRGAAASEVAALKAGTVIERLFVTQFPASFTIGQIQSALQTAYTAQATALGTAPNPNLYYGANFNGTVWSAAVGATPGVVAQFQFGAALPNASGDSVLIAGVANQSIGIMQGIFTALAAVTMEFKDGSTVIGGFQFPTGGGSFPLPFTGNPWFVTSPGNNMTINLSAAVQCAITGWFEQA